MNSAHNQKYTRITIKDDHDNNNSISLAVTSNRDVFVLSQGKDTIIVFKDKLQRLIDVLSLYNK